MRGPVLVLRALRILRIVRLALCSAGACILAVSGTASVALADVASPADAALAAAAEAEAALDFAAALPLYERALALDPSSPRAPQAAARAALLRAHDEGGFAPLARLEQVRRSPRLVADRAAIDVLVADAASFPPGRVRLDAWVLAAEAYAYRLDLPAAAEPLLERVIADPVADHVTTAKAARDLVELRVARGDLGAARAAVTLAGDRGDPALDRQVTRLVRRRIAHVVAIVVLATIAILAAWSARQRTARAAATAAMARASRLVVAYAAYVALAGALLARGYESGTSKPFLVLGLVLVPLLLVARAWGAAGRREPWARGLRATACAAGALGAAFLVLEAVDVAYLDGVGL